MDSQSPTPNNGDVARVFERIADILEVQGENPFKIKAYRSAVDTLRSLDRPVSQIHAEGGLDKIPGFGDAIRSKIGDILLTGTTPLYDRIKETVPEGVIEMLSLPGIGGKTVKQLWDGLSVTTIAELEEALDAGKIATLPGMGAKTAVKIREAITKRGRYAGTLRIDEAISVADSMISALRLRREVERLEVAGEIRRGCDTVTHILISGISSDHEATKSAFGGLPHIDRIIQDDGSSVHAKLNMGIEAALLLAKPEVFGLSHFMTTGSRAHCDRIMEMLHDRQKRGPSLEEVSDWTEDSIYSALGLPYIPTTLRENTGEIEAAIAGKLPRLVTVEDIRGDVHAHTTATDGDETIEVMAGAAKALGYEYMAITDHSYSLAMVGGLTPERLRAQIAEIRALEDSLGIRIFAGSEVDIRADGALDFDDDLLAELDIVIASAHLWNNQPMEAQTKRIIRAIENPHVDLIAHPTGRIITRRDPYPLDIDAVIAAAARTGTALEINAAPPRLDLKDTYARAAAQAGVKIMINTDAHRIVEYDLMHYGVTTAQRAWLTREDVLNTLPLAEFEAWLKR